MWQLNVSRRRDGGVHEFFLEAHDNILCENNISFGDKALAHLSQGYGLLTWYLN